MTQKATFAQTALTELWAFSNTKTRIYVAIYEDRLRRLENR
jgi:hypothetical protein